MEFHLSVDHKKTLLGVCVPRGEKRSETINEESKTERCGKITLGYRTY